MIAGAGKLLAYLPTMLARAAIRLGAVIAFTRLLSPDDYGRYALALAAVGLAHTVVFLWIEATAFRLYTRAADRGWLEALTGTLARLAGAAMLLAALVAAGALILAGADPGVIALVGVGGALSVLAFATNLRREVLRASGRAGRFTVLDLAAKGGGLAAGVIAVAVLGLGAVGPLAGAAVALMAVMCVDAATWRARPRVGPARRRLAGVAVTYGLGVALANSGEVILTSGDRFVIAAILGEAAVGGYAAGYGVAAQLVTLVIAGLGMAAAPLVIRAYEHEGTQAAVVAARAHARAVLAIGAPVAVGLAVVAEPLAAVVIGPALSDQAAVVIRWIAPTALLAGLYAEYVALAFVVTRRTRTLAVVTGAAAAGNIALNIVLVPVFGVQGAIAASIAAYAGALVAGLIVGRRRFALPLPIGDAVRVGAAVAVMAVVAAGVLATPLQDPAVRLVAASLAGAAAYAAAGAAFGVVRALMGDWRRLAA